MDDITSWVKRKKFHRQYWSAVEVLLCSKLLVADDFLWQYIWPFVLFKICSWVILKIHLMMRQVANNKNGMYIIYWIRWMIKYYDQTIIVEKVIWHGGSIFIYLLTKSPLDSCKAANDLRTAPKPNQTIHKRKLIWNHTIQSNPFLLCI
jgi:hypothetical protein